MGRERFLADHGYAEARAYLLQHEGRSYDSKAIIGVAHGYLPGREPLRSAEFTGGEQHVARRLRSLGFHVTTSHVDPETPASSAG
ncbi:hypothetical protein [Saccharomonospora iraqiensis]|uniref:hypothetical protein n=1 Tax=Saccharomonospora iraqiensis TaxID=52698 RepID=UPI00040825D0|nr:hypothetical protein [Saccharomonospora iraqiensis]